MEHNNNNNNNNNNNVFSTERLVTSDDGGDDSDGDLVTDYLNANNNSNGPTTAVAAMHHQPSGLMDNNSSTVVAAAGGARQQQQQPHQHLLQQQQSQDLSTGTSATTATTSNTTTPRSSRGSIHLYSNNCSGGVGGSGGVKGNGGGGQNGAYNMVPIISVTPHSPGTKFSGILDDSLNQLQSIRESLMQMKSPANQNFTALNSMMSSSRLSSSCPSLPDLAINGTGAGNNFWPNQMYGLNMDRRKSWTAIEDLTECTKNSNKSASLSSVDSEESLRAAERLHNRQSRNSAGGISTHSLNEAELVRDIERLVKRNLAPTVCRIPLQKSISTPSIAPVRNQSAKEEKTSRHLSDSEDENRSLLCVRDKNEIDLPEKRRKRGSLFFRKKKDKNKTKGQSTNCDVCGAVINLASYKEHAIECKAKLAKSQSSGKSGSGKSKSGSHSHNDDGGRDYYDGHNQNEQHINYADDVPLIKGEFLYESQIGPHDLGAEPILGIAAEEHDSWSPSVPKEVVKSLKDKQVKRQEHIYEFIMTEKHHCQTLLVMQRVFVDSIQKYFNDRALERMFPRMLELTELHTNFLKKLRQKQHQYYIVDSIADILLEFFSALSAQRLKSAYGEFCSNHRSALDTFKRYMTENPEFAEWYKHCQANPLLKKKGIPECILFVTQRLTKYPLLIDPLLKSSRDDKMEQEKLQKAMLLVKEILVDVDAKVAEKEKEERRLSIYKKIDVKSFAMYKKAKFRKSDMIDTNRQLKFEGVATLMQGRSKMQTVTVVVMSDCLFFLQENSQKYTFFTPENKAGVVSLQKLLIREKAGTESRGIYIISSNPAYPEMYELKVQNPKDKNTWIQAIRKAVREAPTDETESEDYMTVEQKQKLIDARQANMREIIYKLRQKDLEQAILLEEKIRLMFEMTQNPADSSPESNVESFIANFGFYKDLVTDECDTVEIWKRVVFTIQEIIQLASNLYSAATGLPLSRSFSSVGEKQSELFISPTLPKRAETFGGFDERRSKQLLQQQMHHHHQLPSNNLPWRDAVLSTLPVAVMTKRDSMTSDFESTTSSSTLSPHNSHRSPTNNHHHHLNNDNVSIKDHNFAALQVSDHLHTLLCIISQQMTTIQSLQQQGQFRDQSASKSTYRHNDQLEELRNLQDKLQEEKTSWVREREIQERDLEEKREQLKKVQEQIKSEQDDIKQQREQLYRKMEILSSQGLLLSPSVALPIQSIQQPMDSDTRDGHCEDSPEMQAASNDRRKDKWRTSSISAKGTPLSSTASNKTHSSSQQMKQQLPLKLSSLSSSSRDGKSNSMSSPVTSPPVSSNFGGMSTPTSSMAGGRGGEGPMQMFPLKLADKKGMVAGPGPPLVSHHSRTGSSPAVIQQNAYQVGNAARTNTYPKVPDRVRIRSTDGGAPPLTGGSSQSQQAQGIHIANVGAVMGQKRAPPHPSSMQQQQQQQQHYYQQQQQQQHHHHHNSPHHGQTPPQPPPRHFEKEATNKDEEVIYF